MKNALISVYNKEGIEDFAKSLIKLGWTIYASAGTGKVLKEAGLPFFSISKLVGGDPILGHRVVTLSREIHAGLLAKDNKEDRDELNRLNAPFINLVCVDLYPLQSEINKKDCTEESVIELTDIGGPAILRSAAKGQRIVIADKNDRQIIIDWLKAGQPDKKNLLNKLAAKAEKIVSDYVLSSASYHSQGNIAGFIGKKIIDCQYGENAWQIPAGLFSIDQKDILALDKFKLLSGASPSYNNLCDLDRLLQSITHIAAGFDLNRDKIPFIAIGVKHGNACGAAIGYSKKEVLQKMIKGDTRAIFGGVVIVNFSIDMEEAEILLHYAMSNNNRRLFDALFAPAFEENVIELMKRKTDKCRFLVNCALANLNKNSLDLAPRFRYIRGGFLKQPNYTNILDLKNSSIQKNKIISEKKADDLILAWAIGSTSNSNTITLVKDGQLIGNGVGQQDRVGCSKLALERTKIENHDTNGAAAYSDSFFPFTDALEILTNAGIDTILASSGSVHDEEIRLFLNEKNIAYLLIPDKEIRGFFGH